MNAELICRLACCLEGVNGNCFACCYLPECFPAARHDAEMTSSSAEIGAFCFQPRLHRVTILCACGVLVIDAERVRKRVGTTTTV